LSGNYIQTLLQLLNYDMCHSSLINDPALPDKWLFGEEVAYILMFDGNLPN
jgi:hypothetical protein